MRFGLGSCGTTLPKKLSSSMAVRPVWASLPLIRPNLYGLTPSFCSSMRPFLYAERTYSNWSMSLVLATLPSRLPLSQISKSANSSFGERKGWDSPVPLVCVASYSRSHFMRVSAYSRSSFLPKASTIGNIRPFQRLPLWAIASTLAAGLLLIGGHPLPEVLRVVAAKRRIIVNGSTWRGLVAVVTEDDVAVEVVAAGVRRPLVADECGETAGLVVLFRGGDDLLPGAACRPRAGDSRESLRKSALGKVGDDLQGRFRTLAGLDHVEPLRPVGSASTSGLPANRSGKKPMLSE